MLDYSEERKNGSDDLLNSALIYFGVRPTPIDFTAAEPLDVCMSRLKSKAQSAGAIGYLINRPSINVDLYQIDDNTCQFRVLKKQGRNLPVELSGYMEYQSGTTHITGSAISQHLLTRIAIPTIVFLAGSLFVWIIPDIPRELGYLLWLWIIIVIAISVISAALDRRKFIRFVGQAIGADVIE